MVNFGNHVSKCIQFFKRGNNILRFQPYACLCIQCHAIYVIMKKFYYMLETDILRNSSQKDLSVLRGDLLGFGSPKDAQMPSG